MPKNKVFALIPVNCLANLSFASLDSWHLTFPSLFITSLNSKQLVFAHSPFLASVPNNNQKRAFTCAPICVQDHTRRHIFIHFLCLLAWVRECVRFVWEEKKRSRRKMKGTKDRNTTHSRTHARRHKKWMEMCLRVWSCATKTS